MFLAKSDDVNYALLLMALGMGGVILVLFIMVQVMYLMKFFLGEQAPNQKNKKSEANHAAPIPILEHQHNDSANLSFQEVSSFTDKHMEQSTKKTEVSLGRPPIEVITSAVAMYLTIEQEARSKTND